MRIAMQKIRRTNVLLCLFVSVVATLWVACEQPTPGPLGPRGLCLGDQDCSASQRCVRGSCVTKGSDVTRDGGEPDLDGRCEPGQVTPCYSGPTNPPPAPCRAGTRTCKVDRTWGSCIGEVGPSAEICDGKDNDCNGKIDDNTDQIGLPCQDPSKVGACQSGVYTACTNGQLVCTSNTTKKENEICDNQIDDNCDGRVDENPPCTCMPGATRECGESRGACQPGTETCQPNQTWGACEGATTGSPEVCDGVDNDCNGQTDELFADLGKPCAAGSGACRKEGTLQCSADGTSVECSVKAGSSTKEKCDDIDNDCDGQVDEDWPDKGKACTQGLGACQGTGTYHCNQAGDKLLCNAVTTSPTAELCDNIDNDCDGVIDNIKGTQELLTRSCYTGPANTAGKGTCKTGVNLCVNGTWTTECKGEVTPEPNDLCNGKDDNCDGTPNFGCGCTNGAVRNCGTDTGVCSKGQQTCIQGGWGACSGVAGSVEVCDGKDNDCDGQTDEDFKVGQPCQVGVGTCQAKGLLVCDTANTTKCNATAGQPDKEVCDGKDNDCNGMTDDNIPANITCKTQLDGPCAVGTQTCVSGAPICKPTVKPTLDTCRNGQDEDCDGVPDDICGHPYAYAIVNSNGTTSRTRNMSAARIGTGLYRVKGTNTANCGNRPILLTAKSLYMRTITYTCDTNGDYIVRTSQVINARLGGSIARQDSAFYVVQPAAGDTWIGLTCAGQSCALWRQNGNITGFSRSSTGIVRIDSPLCNDANRPAFASVYDGNNDIYATVLVQSGRCYVYTRDVYGVLRDRSIVLWLPNTTRAAYATVAFNASGPVLSQQNTFGDAFARWSVQHESYGNSECPQRSSCKRTRVTYSGASGNSAALVTIRGAIVSHASFTPHNGKLIVSPVRYRHNSTSSEYGVVGSYPFSVLLIQ